MLNCPPMRMSPARRGTIHGTAGFPRCARAWWATIPLSLLLVLLIGPVPAGAQEASEHQTALDEAPGEDQYLAGTVAARIPDRRLVASGHGGYDSGLRAAFVGAAAEVGLLPWLAARASFVLQPGDAERGRFQPGVGLRAQLLRQADHGLDGGMSVGYRQQRLRGDGGLLEGVVALGANASHLVALANLGYAIAPAGDRAEGELRAATLLRLDGPLTFGLQGRLRRELGSTQAQRLNRALPDLDYSAGPVLTYGRASWTFVIHAGVSAARTADEPPATYSLAAVASTLRTGTFALVAVGTSL
jgi:hypothetical protein